MHPRMRAGSIVKIAWVTKLSPPLCICTSEPCVMGEVVEK